MLRSSRLEFRRGELAAMRPKCSRISLASRLWSGPPGGSAREPRLGGCHAGFQRHKAAAGATSQLHYRKQTIPGWHLFTAASPHQVAATGLHPETGF